MESLVERPVSDNEELVFNKHTGIVPFGYKRVEGGMVAIPSELEALKKIGDLVKANAIALRPAAEHLSAKTGRNISHMGLKKRLARGVFLYGENESNV